ncbi:Ceramide glucosyltransferase [Marasmius crinis-equi]|uniref:Ceramide glucosyltransferase n=1 Tax=Marasmius crinis-equi TaxID=585013 RepID=A0ABR3FT14_9AGAR
MPSIDVGMLPFYISCTGLVWFGVLWAIWVLGCRTARKRYRLRPRSPTSTSSPSAVPGVSILRPLKGLDTNLYENLESTFTQQYPNFEILLSVADEHDQAVPVARELIAKYPSVNAKVVIGEEIVGANPKVNNLMKSYKLAAHDILWVIDSNVTAQPGTLARAVDALQSHTRSGKRIGLVHHVPFAYSTESRIGSRIEEAFLNTNHAKMYLAINTVAVESCVVGKSNLYRRSDLERVNGSFRPIKSAEANAKQEGLCGLPAFGKYMAEDNIIASALWHELGLRHDLSCDVARNVVGSMSFQDYVWRRVRWIRVRKHMVLLATLLEPFTESMVVAVIGSLAARNLFGFPLWLFTALHFSFLLYVDLDVYASLAGHPLPASIRWEFLAGWFMREVLTLPIFLIAIFGDEVVWRGKKYRILQNGEIAQAGQTAQHGGFMHWLHWFRRPKDYVRLDAEVPPE